MSKTGLGEQIGPRLRALRKARGLTLSEVARRMRIARTGVARLEKGIHEPTIFSVLAYLKAVGVRHFVLRTDMLSED